MKCLVKLLFCIFLVELGIVIISPRLRSFTLSSSRGADYACESKETHYVCNETRADNPWQNLLGKHKDDECNEYKEQCNGECMPGYMKCLLYDQPGCGHPDKHLLCGEHCREKEDFYECEGACLKKTELCHGSCFPGFRECGEKCAFV